MNGYYVLKGEQKQTYNWSYVRTHPGAYRVSGGRRGILLVFTSEYKLTYGGLYLIDGNAFNVSLLEKHTIGNWSGMLYTKENLDSVKLTNFNGE